MDVIEIYRCVYPVRSLWLIMDGNEIRISTSVLGKVDQITNLRGLFNGELAPVAWYRAT